MLSCCRAFVLSFGSGGQLSGRVSRAFQVSGSRSGLEFGIWDFEFVWDLKFRIWNFRPLAGSPLLLLLFFDWSVLD